MSSETSIDASLEESTQQQEPYWVRCAGAAPNDWPNLRRFLLRLLFWGVCFTLASQSIKRDWISNGPIRWLLAGLAIAAGFSVLAAYGRYLRETDEFQRLIHLEGLAWAFGGTILAVSSYRLLERLGAPSYEANHVIAAMGLLYAFGTLVATWKRSR